MIFGGKLDHDGGAGHSMSACRGYGTVGAESVRTRSIEIDQSPSNIRCGPSNLHAQVSGHIM
jgi:hypothetical protein